MSGNFEFKTRKDAELYVRKYMNKLENMVNNKSVTAREIGNEYISNEYICYEGNGKILRGRDEYINFVESITNTIKYFKGEISIISFGKRTVLFNIIEYFEFNDGRRTIAHAKTAEVYNNYGKKIIRITYSNGGSFEKLHQISESIGNDQSKSKL